MADKNLIMKKTVEKILSNLLKKNTSFKNVDSASLTFLFRAPIKTAMCDWVYGIDFTTKNDMVNQSEITEITSRTITKTMSNISKDTFCLTDTKFESAY